MGEAGVDVGGPKREFMTMLARCVLGFPCFFGEDGRKTLTHEHSPKMFDDIYMAGQMIATVLCHEGPALNMFAHSLIRHITGDAANADWNDIPDESVRQRLAHLVRHEGIDDGESLVDLQEEVNFMNLTPRTKNAVANYYCYVRNGAQIHRFIEGLNIDLKVGELITKYPGTCQIYYLVFRAYCMMNAWPKNSLLFLKRLYDGHSRL